MNLKHPYSAIYRRPVRSMHYLLIAAGCFCLGCRRTEPVVEYRVPKQPQAISNEGTNDPLASAVRFAPSPAPAGPGTMLVALVNEGPQVWYFKLLGPGEVPAERRSEFREFVSSLTFEQGAPRWQLPTGWRDERGTGMRFATIDVGSAGYELSVIALPAPQALLPNVNRWRGQLSLPPVTEVELEKLVEKLSLKEGEAALVELRGQLSAGPPSMGPFAGGPASAQQVVGSTPQVPAAASSTAGFAFRQPEGWRPGKSGPLRRLAFEVGEDEEQAEITVTTLGSLGSEVLPNINRWRNQIGLEPLTQDSLADAVRPIEVSGGQATWVELVPSETDKERSAIIGVIAIRGDTGWFFKMMGASTIVAAESEHFQEFIESVEFPN